MRPELAAGECLLRLEAVVLTELERTAFGRTFGTAPGPLRAALLEATADRGGLPPALSDSVIVGTVSSSGAEPGRGCTVGDRVACPPPATAIPLWIASAAAWDGSGRTVPVQGHAVLPPGTPRMTVATDLHPAVAAELSRGGHVPAAIARAVGPAARVTILGAATTGGAAAILEATACGAEVAAVVATLQESRLAGALGAARVIVADAAGGPATADLLQDLGTPLADVTVVALGEPDVLETAVWVTTDEGTIVGLEPADPREALACASAGGFRHRIVGVSRGATVSDRTLMDRFASVQPFRELVEWRAGVGPLPAAGSPEER